MKKLTNPRWMKVIEEYIWSEDIPLTVLAERTGVPYDTVVRWFRDYDFQKALEKRFYSSQTVEWIKCVKAQMKEAQKGSHGSFNAVKPIVEKNIARVEGMVAPHTQWVQINNIGVDVKESTEDIQDPMMEVQNKVHTEVHEISEQTIGIVEEKTKNNVSTRPYKKQKVNKEKRNALMRLKCRAKKVGLASMGYGRPSKTEKAKWVAKLEKLEKEKGIR